MVETYWTANNRFAHQKSFDGFADRIGGVYDLRPAATFQPIHDQVSRSTSHPGVALYALLFPDYGTNRDVMTKALNSGRVTNLFTAINAMEASDEDAPFHIEKEAASNAKAALALFIAYDVPPPTVFPSGSEILVFKWEAPDATRYAYLDEGVLTFKLYAPSTPQPLTLEISYDAKDDVKNIIGLLHSKPQKITAAEG